jgi:hypothetical protein
MNPCFAEFIGTALLVLLGNGVVANVVLSRTKGHNSGWIVITAGWAIAVFVGAFCAAPASGAHLNPAVTTALALAGKFYLASLPGYVLAQMLGGITGGTLVYLFYRPHFAVSDNPDGKLACFCTLVKEDFIRILTEPQNALIKQYTGLLQTEEVKIEFTKDAVDEIASLAVLVNDRTENIGARRLFTIMEKLLEELSFEAPELTDKEYKIDAQYVKERLNDIVKSEDLSRYIL